MANTRIIVPGLPSQLTGLILKLFERDADTLLNPTGGGEALTEFTNSKGVYDCVVAEAITGIKRAIVTLSDGTSIAVGEVNILADDAGPYYVVDQVAAEATVDISGLTDEIALIKELVQR